MSPRFSERWSTIQERIEREKTKMAKLDERIGQLMSARVDVEERLAKLHETRDRLGLGPEESSRG